MMFKCVAISLVFTLVTAIEPGCENCGCCVGGICAPKYHQSQTVNDFCTHGCIVGIGGNRCYTKCPDDCVTCEQTILKNCATCETGKYVHTYGIKDKRCVDCPTRCKTCSSSTNCQECKAPYYNSGSTGSCSSTCPSRCKSCTSATQCQECNPPYYNDDDVTDCSLSCPGNCLCSTPGVCSSCQDGYYNIQNQCQDNCPDKCKTCSDLDTCQSCMDGYYNGKEYDNANNGEVTDCSLSCRGNCTKCNSFNQCTYCMDGNYGTYCQNACSIGCQHGVCTIGDGSCGCKDGFTWRTCSECIIGRYGEMCSKKCPSACKDKTCNKNTGQCLSCEVGLYGTLCEHNCSEGCKDNDCDSETGSCFECIPSYSGNKCCIQYGFCKYCLSNTVCETCTDGYYGDGCNKACPAMCKLVEGTAQCEKISGICRACVDGFYDEFCTSVCSSFCLKNRCNKDNGHCSEGCVDGYEGPTCTEVLSTTGTAVGISSAVIIVIATVLVVVLCFILRWFRKDMLRQHLKSTIQTSYVNTEFQPMSAESVQSNYVEDRGGMQEYEELNEGNVPKSTDYDQIK